MKTFRKFLKEVKFVPSTAHVGGQKPDMTYAEYKAKLDKLETAFRKANKEYQDWKRLWPKTTHRDNREQESIRATDRAIAALNNPNRGFPN